MQKIILMFVTMVMTLCIVETAAASSKKENKNLATTEFMVGIDCHECEKKVMNFMPYQKGVKDVEVNLPQKRTTVVYDKRKTSDAALIKAFGKIHIDAKVAATPAPKAASCTSGCCK